MEINKNWVEAIQSRVSRRNYVDKELGAENIDKITSLIKKINEESGLKIRFVENGSEVLSGFSASYGMISGARSLIALIGDSNSKNLKKNLGYYGEFLVLECTSLGLGTCWIGGTYNKEACKKSINLLDNEELICIISVGYVKEDKSFKEKLVARLNKKRQSFDEVLIEKDSGISSWIKSGIEASMLAPSAMNKKPIAFSYINGKLKAFPFKKNHGYEDVDLGIAMAHFQLGAFSSGFNGEWKVIDNENIFN